MRRRNTTSIGSLLTEILQELHIDEPIKESRVIRSWGTVLGSSIERVTENIYFKNHVLYVKIRSSVVKNELLMLKPQIMARLNEQIGEELVQDLIIK